MLLHVLILLTVAINHIMCKDKADDLAILKMQKVCGPLGFRCLDTKRYQICPFADSEGTTEEPDAVHECGEFYVCDEDNPAYCTPYEIFATTFRYNEKNSEFDDFSNINENSDDLYPESAAFERQPRSDSECECSEEPLVVETETTTPEPEYFTTLVLQTQTEYDCDRYGFFPDFTNHSLFWYCDVPPSGEGYLLRHMKCGPDRTYDPYKQACILEGTIRDTRTNVIEAPALEKFSCNGKTPGKYEDSDDCQVYHVCLTKNFAPVKELQFACPENTAFDPKTHRCSRLAIYRCSTSKAGTEEQIINNLSQRSEGGIHCKMPSRFRDTRNCKGYYLCYGDQLLEMRCPEFYKFDDNILECLPEGIAKCEETDT